MGYHVLIVDDSPAMRRVIRRTIGLSGFEMETCVEACNGAEALRFLRSSRVDLVLTDINMPVMNGEELLRRMHQDDGLAAIPTVIVSTDASEQRMRNALALGARGYITKPFFPEGLRAALERVLGVDCG